MTDEEMMKETLALGALTKAIYERGWFAITAAGDGLWWAFIYDDNIDSTRFGGSTARAAFDQARDFLEGHPGPMTEERLASILGIERAAA